MEPASHIIGKQRIHLHYKGVTDTLALRQMISKVCSDELPVRLNKLLDQYDDKDFVFRIDKLDVHVTISDDGQLEETLAKSIIEQVEAALRQKLEQRITDAISIDKSFARTLQFYLERGYLPWWSLLKDRAAFQQALQQAWDLPDSLREVVSEVLPGLDSIHVRNRLLSLLNKEQSHALIAATATWTSEEWASWQESFEYIKKKNAGLLSEDVFDRLLYHSILATIGSRSTGRAATAMLAAVLFEGMKEWKSGITEKVIASLPSSVIRDAFISHAKNSLAKELPRLKQNGMPIEIPMQGSKSAEEEENTRQVLQEGESIFINNAGLVLVASYLPAFFRNLGLWKDGTLVEKQRAISMLRQLVFEQDSFEEFGIVLEKILCGIPLPESIEKRHSVTQEEREQVDLLLQSVIEHWTVLKNTSPDGLRHSFLQREGKLVFQHNQWELTVQKQAHDVLVDYIPWNIRMIKLPWMPQLMIVHWNM